MILVVAGRRWPSVFCRTQAGRGSKLQDLAGEACTDDVADLFIYVAGVKPHVERTPPRPSPTRVGAMVCTFPGCIKFTADLMSSILPVKNEQKRFEDSYIFTIVYRGRTVLFVRWSGPFMSRYSFFWSEATAIYSPVVIIGFGLCLHM